jgi:hypothetical protein
MAHSPLSPLIKINRAKFSCTKTMVRTVFCSELMRSHPEARANLDKLVTDKAPLFYRKPEHIIQTLQFGYFATAISETLGQLPQSPSFRESHFGEILATIFAEEVMGLRRIYSKLSLLTSENSNAYKMDLVLYDPNTNPVDIVFGEVKSSPKQSPDGKPVGHDKSCFSSLFNSINGYSEDDSKYDLTAARDHIDSCLSSSERERVLQSLMPYSNAKIRVAGIVVIDATTSNDNEVSVLATRKNATTFDVDIVGVEDFSDVADSVYSKLENLRNAACFD